MASMAAYLPCRMKTYIWYAYTYIAQSPNENRCLLCESHVHCPLFMRETSIKKKETISWKLDSGRWTVSCTLSSLYTGQAARIRKMNEHRTNISTFRKLLFLLRPIKEAPHALCKQNLVFAFGVGASFIFISSKSEHIVKLWSLSSCVRWA